MENGSRKELQALHREAVAVVATALDALVQTEHAVGRLSGDVIEIALAIEERRKVLGDVLVQLQKNVDGSVER